MRAELRIKSNFKATGVFVILLSQDGFESDWIPIWKCQLTLSIFRFLQRTEILCNVIVT